MEFVELKKSLKSGQPAACYACYGDDEFLVERSVSLLGELVTELKPFNYTDREFDSAKAITDELMQLPVISKYRVVVARGKTDIAAISEYLKSPNPSSVLVLPMFAEHDSWNKTSAPSIPEGAISVNCNKLGFQHVLAYVNAVLKRTGASIDADAAKMLYERCAGYMSRIDSELQKLGALRAGASITAADVISTVEPSVEFVVFELCDSIIKGDAARALAIVDGMDKADELTAAYTLIYNRLRRIFVAAVSPTELSDLGVSPGMASRLKAESARLSKGRIKKLLDMLEKADNSYKTGVMTRYDALTCFVAQAAYRGEN